MNDEIAALKQEIAELKKQAEPYKAGDSVTFGDSSLVAAGFLSGGCKNLWFSVPLSRPISATKATITVCECEIRTNEGYVLMPDSADSKADIVPGSMITTLIANGNIAVKVTKDTSWVQQSTQKAVTNNTVCTVFMYNLVIKFE